MTSQPAWKRLILPLCLAWSAQAQSVNVWLTTDDQHSLMQPQKAITWSTSADPSVPAIYIDPRTSYQGMEGFGASFTDSAAYLMNQKIPPAALKGVMTALFDHTQGIGVGFVRNPMGASDLARSGYSYDDQPAGKTDASLASFSIAHDMTDIVPLLKQAKAINPALKVMATPWSAPGWMKSTGSMIGGKLLPSAYPAFAAYSIKYLQAYSAAGIPVDYLSVQNEPLYVPNDYPGTSMSAAEQADLLANHLLPALAANNIATKVLVYDHNWDVPSYPDSVLNDARIANSPQIGGSAWHWYAGTPGSMSTLRNLHPGVNSYVTEASGGSWITDPVKTDFETIIHAVRNWSSSWVKWSLALDETSGPHTGGCGNCRGLIAVNQASGNVTYTVDYYTLGHFSKFVRPGASRIYSSNAPGIVSVAFLNPGGTCVLVAYNDTSANRTFQVAAHGASFVYTLPALAGATFTWNAKASIPFGHKPIRRTQPWQYAMSAKSQQIQASSYSDLSKLQTESTTDANGGYDLGYSQTGSWAQYGSIDFDTGVSSVDVRSASAGTGGTLEFRLDSAAGPIIAIAAMPVTGGWQTWTTVTAPVSDASGVHDLYIVFNSSAPSNGIANLNWFQFH